MTAPDLADVLAEVNRLRAERGMEPLDAMPKGTHSGRSCPLAVALGAKYVGCHYVDWGAVSEPLTATLRQFVGAFDHFPSAYPELEKQA